MLECQRVIWISRRPRCINDGVEMLPYLNSLDIFAESVLVLLRLLQ